MQDSMTICIFACMHPSYICCCSAAIFLACVMCTNTQSNSAPLALSNDVAPITAVLSVLGQSVNTAQIMDGVVAVATGCTSLTGSTGMKIFQRVAAKVMMLSPRCLVGCYRDHFTISSVYLFHQMLQALQAYQVRRSRIRVHSGFAAFL